MLLEERVQLAPQDQALDDIDDDDDEEDLDGYPSLFIGPALRAARLRAGVRQSDIARTLGVDSSVPSRWEGYDSQHDGRSTTRYKPVPGKYLTALADLLHCALADLAPELAPQPTATTTNLTYCTNMTTAATSASTFASMSSSTSISHLGHYTMSVTIGASPVPGRPPAELVESGRWRRVCPSCKKVFVESAAERAPETCDACAAPVRPNVTLTLTPPPTSS